MKKITKDINLPAIGLSYFALFSLSLIENAKSPIYPNLLNEFNLTHKDGSWVFTLASLFGIFATISSNFWLKKFGVFKAKKYLATALVIGTILSSISLNVFKSYSIFLIGCAIVGLAMGGLSITMNLLIDSSVPSKWRRQAFSGLHSLYGMASFCSPAVLILIVNQGFKWQQVFNFLIVFPVLLLIFTRNKKFLPKIKMIKNREDSSFNATERSYKLNIKEILPFAFLLSFYVCGEVVFSSRFRVISQFLWPINEEVSQSYLASFFGLMTLGRVIFVFLRVKLTNQILLMLSLSLSLLFIILGATTDPIFLSLVGLTMSIYFPCALDFISESFPKRINQALPFVLNIVAIKLLIAHFLVGVITDYFGDFSIVYVIGVCISLAFLSIFFCRSSRHQSELQP